MTFERVIGAWNPSRRDNRSNCATIQERNNELPVGALRRETSDNALIVSRRLHKDARGSCEYRSLLRLCNSTNYRHDLGPREANYEGLMVYRRHFTPPPETSRHIVVPSTLAIHSPNEKETVCEIGTRSRSYL
ncbi:hypothetical protein V1477_014858 [Vespula maculifrons]|uniref:Uncharacterized protein n=1 Tax=Vespula maculifrons TaxID=7453 RepID=A0ABD2BIN7_VESMC